MDKIFYVLLVFLIIIFVHLENDNISANAEEENKIIIKDSGLAVEEYISGLEYPVMIDFVGDDMLVIEKAEGTVRIIKNGVLIPEPLIKLEVSNTAEEGLVGILVNGDDVYLHYTTNNLDDGTTNWFTKYSFDGQSLSEPEELLSFHSNESTQHNSGVMFTDKDGNVYGAIGDTCFCDGLFQNNPEGENDNTGSIISLNVPRDIYAIGIRNTYGLDFDPETGILWDTENGPESFDEVNLVEKKFNSGWNRIQGPIKPDQEIPIITDFIYSDPEFSWERPIGVTGIHFVESSKFPQYSNSVLVGSFHDGILYHFKLNENRDGFKFDDETLQDLVLNKEDNPNEIILATGFLGITDIKQGPDGLIYIVSVGDGKIFRISPSVNTILDDSKCRNFLGKDLSGCDFSGKDLSGKDLSGKDLRFVDFSNSSFYDVNFQNSNIVSADFSNSKFFDVNFSNTNLDSAIFRDVKIENTNFKESSLVATKFFNSKLRNNDFKNSDLERTLFSNLELYRVNFENVRFYDSDFENLASKFVNFENTDMTFAEIKNSRLEDSKFDNSRLWKTYFIDSNLQNSSFVNSDNYSSVFKNTDLKNTDFQFSRFSNVDFSNTNFENASLLDIYPIDSAFKNVEFNNTEINTCLNHDVFSRIFNKILRSIDNLGLEIFENLIIDICNN